MKGLHMKLRFYSLLSLMLSLIIGANAQTVINNGNTFTGISVVATSIKLQPMEAELRVDYERGTWLVENGGRYKIKLKIWTKAFGRYICQSTYDQDLVFQGLHLPNVVTPGSSDETNDVFVKKGFESVFGMRLYNIWGQLVRDYETYNNDFDSKKLKPGTYFYHLIPKIQGAEVKTGGFRRDYWDIRNPKLNGYSRIQCGKRISELRS